jgi:16S rRNA processing protein RimM
MIPMVPGFLWIGAITKPHGLKGHLSVQADPASGESFKPGARIYVRQDQDQTAFVISEAKARDNHFILRFSGVEDRQAAEALVGRSLYVREESLGKLPEGEYYWYQLIGLRVVSEEGRFLGCLEEVISTPAHDVWVARTPGKEYLIPAVAEVILSVDQGEGEIKVRALQGLWEVDGH